MPKNPAAASILAGFDTAHLARGIATLKVIAHPHRLAIVDLLNREGRLTVTQIYMALGLPQNIASGHLIKMKTRGVLLSDKHKMFITYYLRTPELANVSACLQAYIDRA